MRQCLDIKRVRLLSRMQVAAALVVCGLAAASVAHADVLAQYAFENTFASSDTNAASTASAIVAGAGLGTTGTWNGATNGINSASGDPAPEWAIKPDASLTSAAAQTNNAYWSFTVTPAPGASLALSSLTFDLSILNAARPISYYLASDVGGFSNPIGAEVDNATGPSTYTAHSYDLSSAQYQGLTSPVEFRLYLWCTAGSGSSGSRWGFDNIALNGTAAAVPEPASLTLALGGGILLVGRRRSAARRRALH